MVPRRTLRREAREKSRIVLTNDLDFGATLAIRGDDGPSVVQLRTNSTLPSRVGRIVLRALQQADADLRSGALLTVEAGTTRVRKLPFRKGIAED